MSALDEVVGYNRHTNICMYSRGNGDCNCVVGDAKKELAALRTENERLKQDGYKLTQKLAQMQVENERMILMADSVPDMKFVTEFERLKEAVEEKTERIWKAWDMIDSFTIILYANGMHESKYPGLYKNAMRWLREYEAEIEK